MNPELVFLHIPKTAGTSQHRSFRQYYGAGNIFWFGDDCPGNIGKYPRKQVGDRLVVGGHKPLGFYPGSFDPLYCAVLRDSVDRAISLFSYYTQPSLAHSERGRKIREEVLSGWLRQGIDPGSMVNSIRNCRAFREEISNLQCAYISASRPDFNSALKTLGRYDFVLGTLEQYDRFHDYLGEILDWPEEQPVSLNRSKGDYASGYLDDRELVDLVRELNREDDRLLEFVRELHGGLYVNLRDPEGRRGCLQKLPLKAWMNRRLGLSWEDVGAQLWPPREVGPAKLPWPLGLAMVSEHCRLMFMPIPGAATPFARRFMLDCAELEHAGTALDLGLGRILSKFRTGLMLADHDAEFCKSVRHRSDYFKFSILSEPVNRLVGVYAVYFVQNREQLDERPNLADLANMVRETRGDGGGENGDRGITFREFVAAILKRKPRRQNSLLTPQFLYLKGMGDYSKLYREDQLELLASDLSAFTGVQLEVPAAIPLPDKVPLLAGEGVDLSGVYADTLPADLPDDPAQWRPHLVDEQLREDILAYYAQDCELYNQLADEPPGEVVS